MPMNQHGFSLTEVLIAMAISSILLLSTSRFTGAATGSFAAIRAQEREEEIWQRLFAIGKQLQRAGYCAGNCQGQSLTIGREEAV